MVKNSVENSQENRTAVLKINQGLCTLNEYIRITRANKYKSANKKKTQDEIIGWYIRTCLKGWSTKKPVYIIFTWVQKDKKKDKDNIAFAKKFILDSLVKTRTIPDDTWDCIVGFEDKFVLDKKNGEQVIVEIREVG